MLATHLARRGLCIVYARAFLNLAGGFVYCILRYLAVAFEKRAVGRGPAEGGSISRLTPAEFELRRDVVRINEASADPRVRAFLRRSSEDPAAPEAERQLDDAAPCS